MISKSLIRMASMTAVRRSNMMMSAFRPASFMGNMPQRNYTSELNSSIFCTTNNFLVLKQDSETGCPILRFDNLDREMHLEGHFTLSHI